MLFARAPSSPDKVDFAKPINRQLSSDENRGLCSNCALFGSFSKNSVEESAFSEPDATGDELLFYVAHAI